MELSMDKIAADESKFEDETRRSGGMAANQANVRERLSIDSDMFSTRKHVLIPNVYSQSSRPQ